MAKTEKIEKMDNILAENINKSIQFRLYDALVKGKYTKEELKNKEFVDDIIDEMYEQGCRPIVTVEAQWVEKVKNNGLSPSHTWDRAQKIDIKTQQRYSTQAESRIRGTFGIPPYAPGERTAFMISVSRNRIAPVYTGPDNTFNGVVQISEGMIRPEELIGIETVKPKPKLELVSDTRKSTKNIISNNPQPEA